MASAEIAIGRARYPSVLRSHGFDRDAGLRNNVVETPAGDGIARAVDDDGRFEIVRGGKALWLPACRQWYRRSSRHAALVIEQVRVVRALPRFAEASRTIATERQQFGGQRAGLLEPRQPLPQRNSDCVGHCLARQRGNSRSERTCLLVFDIEHPFYPV